MNAEPIRVAIATTLDPGAVVPRLRALCDAIGRELDRKTSGHLMISYEELERGAEGDHFHLMWLPPLVALSTLPKGLANALAVPVRGGRTSYATALFTRPESGITSLSELKGRSVAWVDRHSCAGYVLPRALLASKGVDVDADLGEQHWLGSHDRVVGAVLAGRADFGATYVNLGEEGAGAVSGPWGDREARVLAYHGPIPSDLLACGRALEPAERAALAGRLLEPDSELARLSRDLLRCDALTEPETSHLDALAALVASPSS